VIAVTAWCCSLDSRVGQARQRAVELVAVNHRGALITAALGLADDQLLGREQLQCGVAAIEAEADRHDVARTEQPLGHRVQLVSRDAPATCLRQRDHDIALAKRVLGGSQPRRREDLGSEPVIRNGYFGRSGPTRFEALELVESEAVLRRTGPNLLAPIAIGDVSLRFAGVEHDPLAPSEPDLHPRRLELALALENPAPALREFVPHRGRDLIELSDSFPYRAPRCPWHPLADRVAQVRLVYAARRLGVRVDRAAIQCRPAAVTPRGDVRAYHVRVQLRILGPRHAVPIRRGHEPPAGSGRARCHPRGSPASRSARVPLWPRRIRHASRSRYASAAATASSCASTTARDRRSSPTANSTLTLLGAENVRSNAAVRDRGPRTASCSPETGCLPSIIAFSCPASSSPDRPSWSAALPAQRPGASPRPA
jgi:hypothetical protein